MSAGMMELIPTRFDWRDIRDMLTGVFEPRANEKKGIGFNLIELNPMPEAFIGDRERISQVLVNLVGNAIKFTHQGSVSIETDWQEGQVSFRVRDTGIGIDQESMAQLFDPFVQADRTAKRNYEGTGLGLAICKRLVEMMKGELTVVSSKGVGSEFRVKIPLTTAKASNADMEQVVQEAKKQSVRQSQYPGRR
ncbi:ATP-binding protein [Vibrio sinaloensis]|nr:ATP-binding protein [Vibrio sinaloensis]